MRKLNIDISLEGLNLSPEDKKQTAGQIFGKMVEGIILSYGQSKQGLQEKERRQYYKIMDVIDEIKPEDKEIQLEDDLFGFLKKCKADTKMQPNNLLRRVEKKIEEVKQR